MNSRIKLLIACSIVLVAACITTGVWASVYVWKSEQPLVRMIASTLRLPAAKVANLTVTYSEYLTHVDAQRAFLKGPMAVDAGAVRDITDSERREALERAIRIEAVEGLATESGLEVTPLDVDRAYDDLVSRAGTSTSAEEIQAFLKAQFGWDEADYKKNLLRPAYLEEIMRSKGGETFDTALQVRIDGAKRYLRF
jgi:hypothetical protein